LSYAPRDQQLHTYADYLTWPDDIRYELINGHAYLIPPTGTLNHQTISFEVAHQLGNALEGKPCRILMAPIDVMLNASSASENHTIDTVVQPDVLIVCDPSKLNTRGVRGAPDWILEVISPSSASHDQIVKLALYEKAGVAEYWLAHPTDRVLTIYRLDGGSYGRPEICELRGLTAVKTLAGVSIDWEPIVARLLPPT